MQMYSAKKLTFWQYFDRNTIIIIMNRFPFVEVFDFPSNIDLFESTERKGASFICILYCLGVFCISLLILIQDKAFPQTACWCYLILEFETKTKKKSLFWFSTIFLFSFKVIEKADLFLSGKWGLIVFQNLLLSVMSFTLDCCNIQDGALCDNS